MDRFRGRFRKEPVSEGSWESAGSVDRRRADQSLTRQTTIALRRFSQWLACKENWSALQNAIGAVSNGKQVDLQGFEQAIWRRTS